jgi:hypothetical protein
MSGFCFSYDKDCKLKYAHADKKGITGLYLEWSGVEWYGMVWNGMVLCVTDYAVGRIILITPAQAQRSPG